MSWNLGSQTPVLPVLSKKAKSWIAPFSPEKRPHPLANSRRCCSGERGILGYLAQNLSQVEGQAPKRGVSNTALLEEKSNWGKFTSLSEHWDFLTTWEVLPLGPRFQTKSWKLTQSSSLPAGEREGRPGKDWEGEGPTGTGLHLLQRSMFPQAYFSC